MPSFFESLSMVALEAWALGKPVLANASCDVLKGQCIRSNAGLYYETIREFVETLRVLEHNRWLCARARRERPQFFRDHYDWPVIEPSTSTCSQRLPRCAGDACAIEPLPAWIARRRGTLPPAARSSTRHARRSRRTAAGADRRSDAPEGAIRAARRRRHAATAPWRTRRSTARQGALTWPAVHQVLATLGYGDAIGHEVLGIQRVLRAAGYDSEIFVETADPRLEHADPRLPRAGRRQPSRQPAAPPLLDRIAAPRASPSRCPTGWRSSTTTSRRRSTSSACIRRWCSSASGAAASSAPTSTAATSRSATRSSTAQDLEALGFPRTGVLPVVPDLLASRAGGRPARRRQFDDDWTNILFVGRVIPNKRIDDLIRFFHAYQTRFNPRSGCCSSGRTAASSATSRAAAACRDARRARRASSSGTSANEELVGVLRRRRPVPLRQRARGLLRAAGRGVLQAGAGPGLRGHGGAGDDGRRRRAVRRQDPAHVAALMDADRRRRRISSSASRRRRTPRSTGCARRTSTARCSASSTRSLAAPRRGRRRSSFDFWDQFELQEQLEELRMYRPSAFAGAAERSSAGRRRHGPQRNGPPEALTSR